MQVQVRHQPSFAVARLLLAQGEPAQVGAGAMPATSYGKVASGMIQSMKSGEGLVFDFAGPGQVLTQTRNPSALASWVVAQVPGR